MKLIDSTAEILAFKVLNLNIDKRWVNWVTDMLMSAFDTENLFILAGEQVPYNQFELMGLTKRIFDELNIDLSDHDTIIKNYAYYLINKALTGEMQIDDVLNILKELCIKLDYDRNLYDFYLLYFAKEDLKYSDNQWYWNGADKDNINTIIFDYFVGWKQNCSN